MSTQRRAGVEADEKTNDPASDSEVTTEGEKKMGRRERAARVFISPKATGPPLNETAVLMYHNCQGQANSEAAENKLVQKHQA